MGSPLRLSVWVTDDAKLIPGMPKPTTPPVTVTWSKFRGPGAVTFENSQPAVEESKHMAATTATFSEPGDYVLLVVANDWTGKGGRGFQCCWTNGHVKVSVK